MNVFFHNCDIFHQTKPHIPQIILKINTQIQVRIFALHFKGFPEISITIKTKSKSHKSVTLFASDKKTIFDFFFSFYYFLLFIFFRENPQFCVFNRTKTSFYVAFNQNQRCAGLFLYIIRQFRK